MFSTLITVALFLAPAISGVVGFNMATPTLTQCQNSSITWDKSTGGAPYNLIVVPNSDPCGDAIADLGDHNGLSMTWLAALPAGMSLLFSLEDASGAEAWSGTMVVGASNDSSCVPAELIAEEKSIAASSTKSSAGAVQTAAAAGGVAQAAGAAAPSGSAVAAGGITGNGAISMTFSLSAAFVTALVGFTLL